MKKYIYFLIIPFLLGSCSSDSEFLDREPSNILTQNQAFGSPDIVLSVLADLYNRYYDFGTVEDWSSLAQFNVAFWSEAGRYGYFQNGGYGYGDWGTWDYGYIREMNLFLERLELSEALDPADKARFAAEGRFLRASYYFTMVKRMGGVPLILESETYDFSGDATYLQHPRETEAALYDFVISEADAILADLPSDVNTKSRASKGAVLAMKARAALYAGSIARYGASTPQVSLPGGEVGIPASRAEEYYTTALSAAQSIINGEVGNYSLYEKKPDLSENFASIFYDKSNNPEAIFVEDYKLQSGKVHGFTIANQPRFGAEEEEGGRINPALSLVQSFETLDGEYAPLPIEDASGNPIYYDTPEGVFANRDARLMGTVIVPGSSFKGREVDIFAGIQLADGTIISGDSRGQQKEVMGTDMKVVGFDGPIDGLEFTAQTGFYIRKYQDPKAGSGQRGTQSDVWFIRYRYAEVLLNAAEAAFELNQPTVAAGYLNQVRRRAGITTDLAAADITFDRIAHERFVEFAFEGLHFFDLKRWRIAHEVLDGTPMDAATITDNIGDATKRLTQPFGLWPYKYYNPGDANDGTYIYKIVKPNRVTGADRFQFGNYYSEIGAGILNNNPLIVRNPNQ
ncbi:MAG: RagB/SusD family nutrient uptake outer membrane protein [Bacteroidota bacterium]|uniref:RagB/SusD family nutrient uptake outer membrane protein n=2 Tax=unclassified Leeuwenhoekiella TaxID=2615029 RepID=UPI000C5CEEE3|nr:RagB/SusD family nutrient uptake outer membrane protein [Leeuwenhoekiella sp. UBA1003]MAS20386.1 RagB/SusD family nutrient uptake outer membrane protein [Leeuwenhoekiella sp.]MEC7783192.1 RagB/SusD family nutrient uptake outer membrane protein [Bacteroidota bacterium]MEE3147564.1 RagB/SusD family nutrient uptake outer membrane protein [Bacteroidota bacterium]MEE3226128.1 RagB/SusD family nutrient uptake outer membrane protein [Bacteroidota bacterium]HAX15468.1 RagB/SusD family nutrient upta